MPSSRAVRAFSFSAACSMSWNFSFMVEREAPIGHSESVSSVFFGDADKLIVIAGSDTETMFEGRARSNEEEAFVGRVQNV